MASRWSVLRSIVRSPWRDRTARRPMIFLLFGLTLLLTLLQPAIALGFPVLGFPVRFAEAQHTLPSAISVTPSASPSASLFEQGTRLYQAGQFAAASSAFQQAAQDYQSQGAMLRQAAALTNLALSYQQLGQWNEAQRAISTSLNLVEAGENSQALAQTLEIQGGLQLAMGQPDRALETWQRAEKLYAPVADSAGRWRTQLNQAKALQVQGFYRRALALLEGLEQQLQSQPDSATKSVALRSLGDTLQLTGDLAQARRVLQTSLAIAQRLQAPEQISAANLSLGNAARAQQEHRQAIAFYQQAATTAPTVLARLQAQINQVNVLTKLEPRSTAVALFQQIQTQLAQVPASRASAYAHINLAQTMITRLRDQSLAQSNPSWVASLQQSSLTLLSTALDSAQQLQDPSTQAYALGTQGYLQELQGNWAEAEQKTTQALLIAQAIHAPESAYRWQWQLGRIAKAQGNFLAAKTAYQAAISTLDSLRTNLATINREVQFDFRDGVEPVYREAVALLFTLQRTNPSAQNLEEARSLIDQLQLAELDNFFREACLSGQRVVLDELVNKNNPNTAIIYPIILKQELQVIVKIPNQPLRNYAIAQSQATTEATLKQLRQELVKSSGERAAQRLGQEVYRWLIQPIAADLDRAGVDTLVFVLDGEFRNLPMAALYDGTQYLVEHYAVALSVGLQLLQPRAIAQSPSLSAVAAGLIEPPLKFQPTYASLPEIQTEFHLMQQAGLKMQVLLDKAFDRQALAQAMQSRPFNIVHLATHGNFSSRAEETYILAADGAIYVHELDALLRDRGQARADPIELLTLSACQTAEGDARATLGLAGVAIRAGARSTLASLWQVDDRATALAMGEFYRQLAIAKVSKAEALRRAQLALIQQKIPSLDARYSRPRYWAAYVLVGNWL
jgi:CHAT domain-containing protein/tetratricopeptide (TPR) repeat protein